MPLPISKSALKQQFGTIIKEESSQIMKNSPRYKRLHEIDATAPSKHFSQLIAKLRDDTPPFSFSSEQDTPP
jgi:hypothetical protein